MGHGGMSCGMKTLRFVMVVFNIFFFLIGLALVALGIYVKVDPSLTKLKGVLPINGNPAAEEGLSYLDAMAIAIIVLGCILVIIGFLGCCGAMKQVKCFLIIYAILIGAIILVEIGVTIYFVAFKSKFEEQVKPQLLKTIKESYEGPNKLITGSSSKPAAISLAWDFIMYNLKCCGVNNKDDFINGTVWNKTNPWWTSGMNSSFEYFTYPITCCDVGNVFTTNWNDLPLTSLQNYSSCAVSGTNIHETGCYNKVMELIDTAKTWIIVAAVVILVIELAAFIFALALCCRKKKDTMYYSS